MRKFKYEKEKFSFESEIDCFFEKKITKFGNGAKIDAPKELIDRKVIILVEKKRIKKTK
jgi:putative transposon-encoded protein